MPDVGDERALIADAQQVLGDGEPVLSAGVFGLQDLIKPMVAGQMVGGIAGGELAGTAGSMAGIVLGGFAARKLAAEQRGVTLKLIVAVTATKIHVINWDENDADATTRDVATFDRSTTSAKVKHFGLSRILTLEDPATGAQMKLHASAGRMQAQSGPDADVLAELARTA